MHTAHTAGQGPAEIPPVEALPLARLDGPGVFHFALDMAADGLGQRVRVPVVVVRGRGEGPTLGLVAGGAALDGVAVVHRVLGALDPDGLRGMLVAVPVLDVPGALAGQPGDGPAYAWRFVEQVVRRVDYLVELHAAAEERAWCARADLGEPMTAALARASGAPILVHDPAADDGLRAAAAALGRPAITVELGRPSAGDVDAGVLAVMVRLGMLARPLAPPAVDPVVCGGAGWVLGTVGGLLEVLPPVGARVVAGEPLARVRDVYGRRLAEYAAPRDGVVLARSTAPLDGPGGRVALLGFPEG